VFAAAYARAIVVSAGRRKGTVSIVPPWLSFSAWLYPLRARFFGAAKQSDVRQIVVAGTLLRRYF